MMESTYLSFILVPAAAAILIPFMAKLRPGFSDLVAGSVMVIGLASAISHIPFNDSLIYFALNLSAGTPYDIFRGDTFSLLMIITIYTVGLSVVFFSSFYNEQNDRRGTYFALLSLCVAAMSGVVAVRDFFTLYLFMEVAAVCSFALIAFEKSSEGIEGAVKYFFLSAPASLFIMFSVAMLLLYTSGTGFDTLSKAISAGTASPAAITIILGIMTCGFAVKAGLVPFHGWVPDAYQSAPAPISALLSGIVTKVSGVYALVRISMVLMKLYPGISTNTAGQALMFLGAISIVIGAFGAMYQKDFKRMLAFSSISQVGYIVLSAGVSTPLGIAGAIFHMFNHATFKTTLFLNGASIERATGTTGMNKLGGLESKMPWTSRTSVIAMLSTAGIPPLSGFWSKAIIVVALWKAGAYNYAALAVLASVMTLAYFLIMQSKMFFGKTPEHLKNVKESGFAMLLPSLILAALMIAIGLYFPLIFNKLIAPAVML